MILVLLTRFSDSEESDSGKKLCQALAKKGHELFVTSISIGEAREAEANQANEVNMEQKGSITLLHPDYDEGEEPQLEWLAKYHRKYFSYLSELVDVKVIIGLLPGTQDAAVELAETLKSRLIITALTQIPIDQPLKELNRVTNEFWSVGSDVYNHNKAIFHSQSFVFHPEHKKILLQLPSVASSLASSLVSLWDSTMSILVLLYKFSESPDSVLGFELCLQLVRQGYKLYVTTTSRGEWLKSEIAKAEELTRNYSGSITILSAQCSDSDRSSPEWLSNLHRHYFPDLSKMHKVENIIGLLPGTTQTAVDLKKILNCKLVLLATTKVGDHEEDLKKELSQAMREADQIWSVGPDLYSHYEKIRKSSDNKHRNVLLKPFTTSEYYWQHGASQPQIIGSGSRVFVSIWNCGFSSIYKNKRFYSNRSKPQCFSTVCSALGNINGTKPHKDKIQWLVHGLKFQEPIQKLITDHTGPNGIKITALSRILSADELVRKDWEAFLVPDTEDETFNFIALSAIWLGIPTLVSNMSSVGQFLLNLDCDVKSKAVVILSGNVDADREAWKDKIYKEILNENANPKEWARELSNCLHNKTEIWNIDLSMFKSGYSTKERRLSTDTTASFTTAHGEQPCQEVLDKVESWLRTTEQTKHGQVCVLSLLCQLHLKTLIYNLTEKRFYLDFLKQILRIFGGDITVSLSNIFTFVLGTSVRSVWLQMVPTTCWLPCPSLLSTV